MSVSSSYIYCPRLHIEQRQTNSGLRYCSVSHKDCCIQGSFPVAFPCVSFLTVAKPLERLTRPLAKKRIWLFCPPRYYGLLTAVSLSDSRKLVFSPLNKKRLNLISWLCFSPSSCAYQEVMGRLNIFNFNILLPWLAAKQHMRELSRSVCCPSFYL